MSNETSFAAVTIKRLVEVSHWGNIAIEERTEVENKGAVFRVDQYIFFVWLNISFQGPFSRIDLMAGKLHEPVFTVFKVENVQSEINLISFILDTLACWFSRHLLPRQDWQHFLVNRYPKERRSGSSVKATFSDFWWVEDKLCAGLQRPFNCHAAVTRQGYPS